MDNKNVKKMTKTYDLVTSNYPVQPSNFIATPQQPPRKPYELHSNNLAISQNALETTKQHPDTQHRTR